MHTHKWREDQMVELSGNSTICKSWICPGGEVGSVRHLYFLTQPPFHPRVVLGLEVAEIHTWKSPQFVWLPPWICICWIAGDTQFGRVGLPNFRFRSRHPLARHAVSI